MMADIKVNLRPTRIFNVLHCGNWFMLRISAEVRHLLFVVAVVVLILLIMPPPLGEGAKTMMRV